MSAGALGTRIVRTLYAGSLLTPDPSRNRTLSDSLDAADRKEPHSGNSAIAKVRAASTGTSGTAYRCAPAAVVAVRVISPLRRWNIDWRMVSPITPGTANTPPVYVTATFPPK